MKRWAVNWSEGMALTPQHLQASDRHAHRRSSEAADWLHPFAYGLRKSGLDVQNGEVVLTRCEARFRDGTVLSIPEDLESDSLRAVVGTKLDAPGAIATVFLVVPASQVERYTLTSRECDDDSGDGLPVAVEFRSPRADLAVVEGDTPPAGFVSLPLATIRRSSGPGGPPEIKEDVVPPLLVIDGWPPLTKKVRDVSGLIHGKVERLSAQMEGRPLGIDPRVANDAARVLKLMAFNAADVHLRAVCATTGLHPWYVFLELCRCAGQVAPFRPGRSVAKVPEYRHEDLGACFDAILGEIKAALGEDEAPPYLPFPFKQRPGDAVKKVEVVLSPSWQEEQRPIYLGVATQLDAPTCERLLRKVDLTIAGRNLVGQLHLAKKRGLDVSRPTSATPGLPADGEVHFFQFHDVDGVWDDAWSSESLAIQVNPKKMTLVDDGEFEVALGAVHHGLRFILYVLNPPR